LREVLVEGLLQVLVALQPLFHLSTNTPIGTLSTPISPRHGCAAKAAVPSLTTPRVALLYDAVVVVVAVAAAPQEKYAKIDLRINAVNQSPA